MATTRFIHKKDFETKSAQVLRDVGENGDQCYITEENGKAKAVLMDIDRYNALMDIVEDIESPDKPAKPDTVSVRGILKSSTTRILRRPSSKGPGPK